MAAAAVHEATGTFVVVIGAGQLVATKELPAFAPLAEQVATGTLVVVNGAGHVVSV